jgi:hypothetical protein
MNTCLFSFRLADDDNYRSNETLCSMNSIYLSFNEGEIVITTRQLTDFHIHDMI